jgi:hypothetical protein
LLTEASGNADVQYVWRFLREHNIDLGAANPGESSDPEFVAKAAHVVDLYVDPPAKAFCVSTRSLRSGPWSEHKAILKLPNGRTLTGQSHDYQRHGTTTLFAALEVATGKIIA